MFVSGQAHDDSRESSRASGKTFIGSGAHRAESPCLSGCPAASITSFR